MASMTTDVHDVVLAWFDQYHRGLYGYICLIVHQPDDAKDVLQELFAELLGKGGEINNVRHPKTYLYTAARYKACRLVRERARSPVPLDGLLQQPSVDIMPRWMTAEMLNWALNRIPDEEREVVILKTHDRMTFREIADVTRCLLPTAASRYWRGIHRLRALLEKHHEDE